MTLLLTIFAAVAATMVWYTSEKARELKVGMLCYMFWGASIMWFIDAIFEYAELGAEYFLPALQDVLNDTFLGISVIALALMIWIIVLLVKDPNGIVRKSIKHS